MINLRDDNQYFDERHTLFGRIIKGWDFLMELQKIPRDEEKPQTPVIITKCGELRFENKLKKEQCTDLGLYEHDQDLLKAQAERAAKKRARTQAVMAAMEKEQKEEEEKEKVSEEEIKKRREEEIKRKKDEAQRKRDETESYVEEI